MNHFKNAIYHWQGKNRQGQIVFGQLAALSVNLAKSNLQKKGIHVVFIEKKPNITFYKKITALDITLFFRQLATLIYAGISISQAINILSQNSQHAKLLKIISSIKEDIATGNGLAHAMQKFPAYFDDVTCNLILAGEKSGTLDVMLERIAEHKEQLFLLKSKIKQALFYPIMILLVATIVTIVMLIFVVPRFTDLFQNMHAELPVFTLCVIHFANFLKNDWPIIFILFALIAIWFYFAKRFSRMKLLIDTAILKMPLIGISLQKFILAQWMRSLTTIFAAGIPITEALKILTHSIKNSLYRNAIQELYHNISAGKQLHLAMQSNKLFPGMMIQMIQVGEESGALEKMLAKVADFYESDLDRMISHLGRLLEPLIMIILGVVIGGLVIAMYLPIFKLGAVI
jgi:type IV pilus assembly protein PilC